jgi:hypothetical protein
MPQYKSMLWPLRVMFSFVNIKRVLVIASEKGTLVGVSLMEKRVLLYWKCLSRLDLLVKATPKRQKMWAIGICGWCFKVSPIQRLGLQT